jgi:hypothetical protein
MGDWPPYQVMLALMSFAQHATTMFFPHFVGDAGSREVLINRTPHLRRRVGPKCPIRTPEMAALIGGKPDDTRRPA